MEVREVMTMSPEYITPQCTICDAAKKMRDLDTGFLPVGDPNTNRIVGAVTDRDIAVQAVAAGRSLDTPIEMIMHQGICYCYENDDVEDASQHMRERQIRRLIVLNDDKKLTGVLSLGDLALRTDNADLSGNTLKEISVH